MNTTATLTKSMYRSVLKHVTAIQKHYGSSMAAHCPSATADSSKKTKLPNAGTATEHDIIAAAFCNLLPPEAVLDFAKDAQWQQGIRRQLLRSPELPSPRRLADDARLSPVEVAKIIFRVCLDQLGPVAAATGTTTAAAAAVAVASTSASRSNNSNNGCISAERRRRQQQDNLLYGFEAVRRLSLMEQGGARFQLELRRACLLAASQFTAPAAAAAASDEDPTSSTSSSKSADSATTTAASRIITVSPGAEFKYPLVSCVRSSRPEMSPFELPAPFVGTPICCVSDQLRFTAEELRQYRAKVAAATAPSDGNNSNSSNDKSASSNVKSGNNSTTANISSSSSSNTTNLPPLDPRLVTLHEQVAQYGCEPLYSKTLITEKLRLPLPPAVFYDIMNKSAQKFAFASSVVEAEDTGAPPTGSLYPRRLATSLSVDTPIRPPRNFDHLLLSTPTTRSQDPLVEKILASRKLRKQQQQAEHGSGGYSEEEDAANINSDSRGAVHGFVRVTCSTQCVQSPLIDAEILAVEEKAKKQREKAASESPSSSKSTTMSKLVEQVVEAVTGAKETGRNTIAAATSASAAAAAAAAGGEDKKNNKPALHPFLEELRQKKLQQQQQQEGTSSPVFAEPQSKQQPAETTASNAEAAAAVQAAAKPSHFTSDIAYKIRIENHSDDFAVIVLSRHWHFVTFNDQQQQCVVSSTPRHPVTVTEVCGPGVVGYMPLLGPTAVTSYESGTALKGVISVPQRFFSGAEGDDEDGTAKNNGNEVLSSSSSSDADAGSSSASAASATAFPLHGVMLGTLQCIAIPYRTVREVQRLQEEAEQQERRREEHARLVLRQRAAAGGKFTRRRRGQLMDDDEADELERLVQSASSSSSSSSTSSKKRSADEAPSSSASDEKRDVVSALALDEIDPLTGYPRGGFCFDVKVGPVALDPTVRRYEPAMILHGGKSSNDGGGNSNNDNSRSATALSKRKKLLKAHKNSKKQQHEKQPPKVERLSPSFRLQPAVQLGAPFTPLPSPAKMAAKLSSLGLNSDVASLSSALRHSRLSHVDEDTQMALEENENYQDDDEDDGLDDEDDDGRGGGNSTIIVVSTTSPHPPPLSDATAAAAALRRRRGGKRGGGGLHGEPPSALSAALSGAMSRSNLFGGGGGVLSSSRDSSSSVAAGVGRRRRGEGQLEIIGKSVMGLGEDGTWKMISSEGEHDEHVRHMLDEIHQQQQQQQHDFTSAIAEKIASLLSPPSSSLSSSSLFSRPRLAKKKGGRAAVKKKAKTALTATKNKKQLVKSSRRPVGAADRRACGANKQQHMSSTSHLSAAAASKRKSNNTMQKQKLQKQMRLKADSTHRVGRKQEARVATKKTSK